MNSFTHRGIRHSAGPVGGAWSLYPNAGVLDALKASTALLLEDVRRLKAALDTLDTAPKRRAIEDARVRLDSFETDYTRQIEPLLSVRAKAKNGTGMNAHYRFVSVPPGDYALFTTWEIGERRYQWWVPVRVKAGDRLTQDLDNSNVTANAHVCTEIRGNAK